MVDERPRLLSSRRRQARPEPALRCSATLFGASSERRFARPALVSPHPRPLLVNERVNREGEPQYSCSNHGAREHGCSLKILELLGHGLYQLRCDREQYMESYSKQDFCAQHRKLKRVWSARMGARMPSGISCGCMLSAGRQERML
jgi:hypothetical protein